MNIKTWSPEDDIMLKISNLCRKEVKTIMKEVKKPGRQTVETDLHDLKEGICFYSISSNDLMVTRKNSVAT